MLGPEEVTSALLDAGQAVDNLRDKSGIIPLSIFELFEQVTLGMRNNTDYTIKCSYLEIYNESVNDLLSVPPAHNLRIREFPRLGMCVIGSVEKTVTCPDDVFQCLALGTRNRVVSATELNQRSSRSHTLFIVGVEQKLLSGTSKFAKINLVDLAGSEKVSKTGATGQDLKEAQNINLSLTTLGRCIKALSSRKDEHIPFRESKLTMILKEALGGNARTSLICTVSQKSYHLEESKGTLKFAERAKKVQNKATSNVKRSPEELLAIIDQLKVEISSLRKHQQRKTSLDLTPRSQTATPDEEIYVKYAELKAQFDGLMETSQFEVEKLRAEQEHCAEVNLALAHDLEEQRERLELLQERLTTAETERDALRSEHERDVMDVRTLVETTVRDLGIVREELRGANERLAGCKQELNTREIELEQTSELLSKEKKRLSGETQRGEQLVKDLAASQQYSAGLKKEVSDLRQRLQLSTESEVALQTTAKQVTYEKEALERRLSLTIAQNEELQTCISALTEQLQTSENRYNGLLESSQRANSDFHMQLFALTHELEESKKSTSARVEGSSKAVTYTKQQIFKIMKEMTDLQNLYQDMQMKHKLDLASIKEAGERKATMLEVKVSELTSRLEAETRKGVELSKQLKFSLIEVDSLKFFVGKTKGEAVTLNMQLRQEKELCETFQRELRELKLQPVQSGRSEESEMQSARKQWKALERCYKSSVDDMTTQLLHLAAENAGLKDSLTSKEASLREHVKRIEGLKADIGLQGIQIKKLQQALKGLKQVTLT